MKRWPSYMSRVHRKHEESWSLTANCVDVQYLLPDPHTSAAAMLCARFTSAHRHLSCRPGYKLDVIRQTQFPTLCLGLLLVLLSWTASWLTCADPKTDSLSKFRIDIYTVSFNHIRSCPFTTSVLCQSCFFDTNCFHPDIWNEQACVIYPSSILSFLVKPLLKGNLNRCAKWCVSLNLSSNLQVNLTLFAKYLYACQSQIIEVEGMPAGTGRVGLPMSLCTKGQACGRWVARCTSSCLMLVSNIGEKETQEERQKHRQGKEGREKGKEWKDVKERGQHIFVIF